MGAKVGGVSKSKERLDKLMVLRGLVNSRSRGQTLVMAGEVRVNGERAVKSSMIVGTDAKIELIAPMPYVSRGGMKLAAALTVFDIVVREKICADVGACTGGFTDVLLQHGMQQCVHPPAQGAPTVGNARPASWHARHAVLFSRVLRRRVRSARILDCPTRPRCPRLGVAANEGPGHGEGAG